ncbi:MAG TPA: methyltransferase domain-containing protein [Thermoanaerobaculia bacterium]|nr:methyltransferase domain-containing protein [Thermoanaerobaculia bacterium]
MSAVTLLCPVRGCGAPLARNGRALACPRGHRFDLARSGYCNLLQPQERRSRRPGDSAAALAARRRLFDRGLGDWLIPHLLAAFDALRLPPRAAVLDLGCGEGFYLGSLARKREIEAHGLDISAPAVDLAARRHPGATWIVANADRALPYPAGSFRLALSLTSRLNPNELRRVLAGPSAARSAAAAADPAAARSAAAAAGSAAARAAATAAAGASPTAPGFLLLAVPAPDDLVELRAAVLGEGRLRDRLQPALAALAAGFELAGRSTARTRLRLAAGDLGDLLAATYRGARTRERQRAAELAAVDALDVTMSRDLAWLRARDPR